MKLVIANRRYSSWSLRPWLAMKHFEIPFEQEVIALDQPDTRARIGAISPSGRVPVLIDGAIKVWESLAICEYLAEKFPERRLWPANTRARATARSIANEMHAGFMALRSACPMNVMREVKGFEPSSAVRADLARIDRIWSDCLATSGGPFLFGDFSIADAMYAPVVFRIHGFGLPVGSLARDYVKTMLDLPATRAWVKDASTESQRIAVYEK